MGTITKIFKPRRGLKSTMTGTKASTVLSSGEMFIECQGSTVGKGKAKIKIGDGTSAYSSLDYAVGDTSTDPIAFSANTSSSASSALSSVSSGATLQTIVAGLKQAASLNASAISKLNDENFSNTNSINSLNTSISSLNNKVSANTNNINTINTTLSTGIGDTYSYIKVFALNSAVTTVCVFIGDECYGTSIVKDGIAIIPVRKKGEYIIKGYYEKQDGTYDPRLVTITTTTITNLNSVVTAVLAKGYGENGKYGDLSFANTTDAQFANIVLALDSGKFTTNDLQWKVGDTRKIHFSAMPATYVDETQPEQDASLVIYNIGGVTLTNGSQCHYVVGLKKVLSKSGYMNPTNTNEGSWKETARRKWCNEIFRNAIPEQIRSCFKRFRCITATEYNSDTVTTTDDYFALPAYKEFDNGYMSATSAESDALISFTWLKSNYSSMRTTQTWERSPSDTSATFCVITDVGTNINANTSHYILPFGCI